MRLYYLSRELQLKNLEAEGGIEPPYTALQAVDHNLFIQLINELHEKSGNPLLKPTLRRWAPFPYVYVLNSTTILVDALFTTTQQRIQFQSLRRECICSIIKR